MQYTTLGDTGLVVSRLAFGAMTFGESAGPMAAIRKVDQPLANRLVNRSLDAGINFFNTADAYADGNSERMLAEALGARRKDVVITTKAGFRMGDALIHQGLSRHHLMAAVEGCLERLKTDYIDVFIVHRLDPFTPAEETLETLDDIVHQGKVRYIGFSNWPAWLAAKSVGLQIGRGLARFRAAELYYCLVGRDAEHELVPLLEDAGIGMLVWSPLAGGFLTGKYTRQDPSGGGGRLSAFDFIPVDKEKGYDLVEAMRGIAAAHDTSIAAVALAWLLRKRSVASILIGASTIAQLESNLAATDLALSDEAMAALDQMTASPPIYPNWFNQNIKDGPVVEALKGSAR